MLEILSGPIIGAVIGYCTNYIAVKMLFYPKKEIRIFGHKMPFTPGAIPKGKPRLAKGIGNIVANTLLTEEDIRKKILTQETENTIVDKIMGILTENIQNQGMVLLGTEEKYESCKENIIEILTEQILEALKKINIGEIIAQEGGSAVKEKVQGTMLAMFLSDEMLASFIQPIGGKITAYIEENGENYIHPEIAEKIKEIEEKSLLQFCEDMDLSREQVREKVTSLYRKAVEAVVSDLTKQLQIEKIIEEKINQMSVEELEKLVLAVMKKELDTIVNLGALVGGILGILNIFL